MGARHHLWQDQYVGSEYGIWARLAYPDGTMEPDFEVMGPRAGADRQYPAVAGGRSTFLVVWEHDRDGGTNIDIHRRLIFLDSVFSDGFESGSTAEWSSVVP